MEAARKRKTYDDLLDLSQEVHAELHAGTIVTQPSGLPEHGRALRILGRFIGGPFEIDAAANAASATGGVRSAMMPK